MWLVVAIPSHQSRVARVVEKESQFWSFDVTIAKQHVSPAFVAEKNVDLPQESLALGRRWHVRGCCLRAGVGPHSWHFH
jgi:hypothetical protein